MMRALYLCALLGASSGIAAAQGSVEAELATRLESGSIKMLDQLLGPGNARVVIAVEGERIETHNSSELMTPLSEEDGKPVAVFPGYKQDTPPFMQRDQSFSAKTSNFKVSKIDVSLLVDDRIADDRVEEARKVLTAMLRLDLTRGDEITVIRAKLYPGWRRIVFTPDMVSTMVSQSVLLMGFLLLCGTFYLLAMRAGRWVADMADQRRMAQGQMSGTFNITGSPGEGGALPFGGGGGGGRFGGDDDDEESAPRFSYLAGKSIRELSRLFQHEPPVDLAVVFAWLTENNPDLGTRVFTSLPENFRLEVSKAMLQLDEVEPERLIEIDTRLRGRVEFSFNGSDKLGVLLGPLGEQERNSVLSMLAQVDAEKLGDLQKSLFTFDNLLQLEDGDLRRLVGAVPIETLAQSLQDSDGAVMNRFLTILPAGVRPLLEEAQVARYSKERVTEARSKVLAVATSLAQQGRLNLEGRGGGAA